VDVVSRILVCGAGAVSPAGWGVTALRAAVEHGEALPVKELVRPGWKKPLFVRTVPAPNPRPSFLGHARLRRTSPISQYAVAAALEALGGDVAKVADGSLRLGVVLCAMSGCVNYSRRFYDEVLRDPPTASPLVFPETVFNAPSSHLAALLGTTSVNYTLVGDPGTFLQGLALAAQWLSEGLVEGCLVAGAEEMDWLTAEAFRLFTRKLVLSEGAGALYLRAGERTGHVVEMTSVTDSHLFWDRASRLSAAKRAARELRPGATDGLLCDGRQNVALLDSAEEQAWNGWSGQRLSPKKIVGEGLMAAAAWQCVLAYDVLQSGGTNEALVSVAGCNQQVIGAQFKAG
jgi:3-oxoacyl-(acyl-carrier-protein) synthase